MAEMEARAAMQMANAVMDGTSRVLEAMIAALADRTHSPRDHEVLKAFDRHVKAGGRLLALPVDQTKAAQLDAAIRDSGLTMYKVQAPTQPTVYHYLFRDTDAGVVDSLILQMRRGRDGIDLLTSRRVDYSDLAKTAAGAQIETVELQTREEAEELRLQLDSHGIQYACTDLQGKVEIAVAADDAVQMREMPAFRGYQLHAASKKTAQDIRGIIDDMKGKAQAEEEERREQKRSAARK